MPAGGGANPDMDDLARASDNWRLSGKPAQAAHVAVAKAIARFELVTVAVSAGQYETLGRVWTCRIFVWSRCPATTPGSATPA